MNSYRNLNEYLEANGQARRDVIEGITEAALTLLSFVEVGSSLEVRDIVKLSEPLLILYGIMSKVNENVSKVRQENA